MSSSNSSKQVDSESGEMDKNQVIMAKSLLGQCYRGLSELQQVMAQMDETGLRLTQTLSTELKDSAYQCVGDALAFKMSDVYTCAKSQASLDILGEMGSLLSKLHDLESHHKLDADTYQHTLCHVSLLLIKLKRQYYSVCNSRVAELVHSLLCIKGEEPAAGDVTKLVLKLGLADGLELPAAKSNSSLPSTPWGSPKVKAKSKQDATSPSSSSGKVASPNRSGFRIMSLFERKSHSEERSSFYVDVDEEKNNSSNNTIDGSAALHRDTAGSKDKNDVSGTLSSSSTDVANNIRENVTSTANKCSPDQHQMSSGVHNWAPPTSNLPPSSLACTTTTTTSSSSNNNNNNSNKGQGQTGSQVTPLDVKMEPASKLASEEDLDSIISLLSGVSTTFPMGAIPEVPPPHPLHPPHMQQGGPIQLVVPQIYHRLPSPASDTQVEELRSPSRQHQAHRRSEGCLDLSSMRPSFHHHQQQQPLQPPHLHHQHPPPPHMINTQQPPPPLATNLPWVQIQSASSQGSISAGSIISDCPSPLSGYAPGGDSSSPGYAMSSPSPSFPSSPARLPVSSSANNSNSLGGAGVSGAIAPNTLNVMGGPSVNMRGRSLSPFQHHQQQPWGGVGGSGGVSPAPVGAIGSGGGSSPRLALTPEFGPRKQGTWPPMYGGGAGGPPHNMGMGWAGVHDSSDLSDDSSTEDQFFAVGTDLCHALDSKGGSSEEEGEPLYPGQAKNSSTWPLTNIQAGVTEAAIPPNRGLTPDLLEPPDLYQHQHHQQQQHHHQSSHRPVQMQWSDPMSSTSMWPDRNLDPSQRKTSQSMYGFGGMP